MRGGREIWDSGAAALDVCEKSASRAVSPITPDCQFPPKVNQVHSRQSFPPRSDGRSLCSARFCSHLTVGVKMSVFAVFLSPKNLQLCLFVCTGDGAGRHWNTDRRHFLNDLGERRWAGSSCRLCLHKRGPFVFQQNNQAFHREPGQPCCCRLEGCSHTSMHGSVLIVLVCLCHLGLVLREISLFCLLTTGGCGFQILCFTFSHFQRWTPSACRRDPCLNKTPCLAKTFFGYHLSAAAHRWVMGHRVLKSCSSATQQPGGLWRITGQKEFLCSRSENFLTWRNPRTLWSVENTGVWLKAGVNPLQSSCSIIKVMVGAGFAVDVCFYVSGSCSMGVLRLE